MKTQKFIITLILLVFLTGCSNANTLSSSISKEKNSIFDELIENSDCCVEVSLTGPHTGHATSRKVGKDYYIDMWVLHRGERDHNFFEEKITIIQEDEPYLETPDLEFSTPYYLLFLTKTDTENTYYITGGKNSVIRTNGLEFKAINDDLNMELNKLFTDGNALDNWRKNIYNFSSAMIPEDSTWEYTTFPHYDTFSWDMLTIPDTTTPTELYTEGTKPHIETSTTTPDTTTDIS